MEALQAARDTVYSFIGFEDDGELAPIEPSQAQAFLEAVVALIYEAENTIAAYYIGLTANR